MRPVGTAEELQRRRLRAVELVAQGESPDDVARFLGCGRTSAYTWVERAKRPLAALAAKPHPGPKPRLSDAQLKELEALLLKGAKADGWRTELWTAARVAAPIERHFQVRFHPEHVRKVLKRRLRWTSQEPQRRAKEREEVAIDHRMPQELPKIVRRVRRRKAHLVSVDESSSMPTPTVRRTPAPRGRARSSRAGTGTTGSRPSVR